VCLQEKNFENVVAVLIGDIAISIDGKNALINIRLPFYAPV